MPGNPSATGVWPRSGLLKTDKQARDKQYQPIPSQHHIVTDGRICSTEVNGIKAAFRKRGQVMLTFQEVKLTLIYRHEITHQPRGLVFVDLLVNIRFAACESKD